MNTLTWYIMKTVLLAVLVVLGIMSGLYVIFTFIAQTGDIGQGSYSSLEAFYYVLMTLPANIYLFLPVAGLLGTLAGLGLLASHSELLVMRSAGVSIRRIGYGVFLAGLVMLVFAFLLGAFLGPYSTREGNYYRSASLGEQNFLQAGKSFWLKDGSNFVFVGKTKPGGRLFDVVKYNVKNSALKSIITAKEARYKDDKWLLHDATQTNLYPDHVTKKFYKRLSWPSLVAPPLLSVVASSPSNLTLFGLVDFIHYQKSNGLNTTFYDLQFWRLIFQPLSVLVLMLLALPFVFGALRSSAMGWQMSIGLLFGLGFFFVDRFFGPFSEVYHLPAIWGAALPSLIVMALLVVMSFRLG